MKDKSSKRPFAQRINDYLREPEGETFKAGKWRFWFPTVILLSALNAVMTAWIFGSSGGVQASILSVVIAVGGLACWLAVGNLHYSDSSDVAMARSVSLLDSITLVFVIAHFCFLLWALGHLVTLRAAESEYQAQAKAYNEEARSVSGDNVKIAEAGVKIAEQTTQAERLRRQTAYQQRKAAEAGAKIRASAPGSLAPSLSTAPIELEKPKAPAESSTVFLAYWDRWIRLANFGELILAAITLIYIRNRSARYNAPYLSGNGPRMDSATVAYGLMPQNAPLRQENKGKTTVATVAQESPLEVLRGHLKVIAFPYQPGRWFKADLIAGGVKIRFCERRAGREVTIVETRQSDKLLAAVNRPDFRERLIEELIHQGFPIGGER